MERPSVEDICKLLSIKQGQNKKDVASDVARDFLKTGKLHAFTLQKGKPSPKPVEITETK